MMIVWWLWWCLYVRAFKMQYWKLAFGVIIRVHPHVRIRGEQILSNVTINVTYVKSILNYRNTQKKDTTVENANQSAPVQVIGGEVQEKIRKKTKERKHVKPKMICEWPNERKSDKASRKGAASKQASRVLSIFLVIQKSRKEARWQNEQGSASDRACVEEQLRRGRICRPLAENSCGRVLLQGCQQGVCACMRKSGWKF